KVNKTLTWNMAKLMLAEDGLAAVPHIPGNSSIERFLKATEGRVANKKLVSAVRDATRGFERVIEEHVGDRATLDLVIDGLPSPDSTGLEQSRKRAYLGNSGIYGVQTKVSLQSCLLAPNPDDPDQLDIVMLRGLIGVRRLRPSVRLPLIRTRQWSDAGQAIGSEPWVPIEEGATSPVLSRFNQGDVPHAEAVAVDGGTDYVIHPGPIGNRGAFDWYFGDMIRSGACRYRTDNDATGEFGLVIASPTETLVFDLIAHRDLSFVLDAECAVHAHLYTDRQVGGRFNDATLLPIHQRAVALPGSPPAVATRLVPRYREIHDYVFKRLGWDPKAFCGVRLEMKYPPLDSTVMQRFCLPEAPTSG
ncbi:MAG: hypothetical protein KDA21_14295, partial [Phycisphaerales bacterium]|nr:hypothetical protein [Phycisphaerales bacterium]